MGKDRLFTGRSTNYHQLNAQVVTGANTHKDVSIEIRDNIATVRKGAQTLEQRGPVTRVFAHDPHRATLTFEDGTTWESTRTSKPCGCS